MDYAKTFLLIAPNVIVFVERLRTDFEGGQIFNTEPRSSRTSFCIYWDFQCVTCEAMANGRVPWAHAVPQQHSAIFTSGMKASHTSRTRCGKFSAALATPRNDGGGGC